ncbi:MAG: 50S ribosomal protein L3 [Candidatus Altarchaeum sp. CG12_big_fil_rev_8_21_14_0_65_33_22]|nr:50S ribosomal protein L3 [Candidatus Altarchaeum hamiconexum]OIQ04635.1 MAG: 50S ribosomal protein L3 [Candidatus Altarchaeum sp. CG2_30_32_3053]PIN67171.1 MAG: 50S ribosomal protein L3 [Candidatus Altarchaeum sp. CG12_big_fil_rev_8_21_14_0_65_33_22]PJC15174.1 MAG: 50S ribosomal protein L3 [Candidatus Altarchaeum sp. CG_4_9_14_0_8_um_filter_32_206]
MAKKTKPRCGSLAYSPRQRASRVVPKIKKRGDKNLGIFPLGFAGYKVGMAQIMATDITPHSPTNKINVAIPCTIIATPPLKIFGIRFYHKPYIHLMPYTEVISEKSDKDLSRVIHLSKNNNAEAVSKKFEEIEKNKDEIKEVKLLCCTNPRLLNIKKKPDILEIPIGGDINTQINFAKENFGKEINVDNTFKENTLIAVSGVTKGKGWQGAVKRWGIITQGRKVTGKRRHSPINPVTPRHTSWRAPQGGQVGYHMRTETNRILLKISKDNITPKGGFLNFGVLNDTKYVIVKGSVPGPAKRIIGLSFNPYKIETKEKYELKELIV